MDNNSFSIKKQNIRTLSLVIFTLMYLLTGAVVFDQLESKAEEKSKEKLLNEISKFKRNVNISDAEFEKLYKHILKRSVHKKDLQWNFFGSFFFCSMAIALIGYGHSTPNTIFGKTFCIIYTLLGIPISLIMFQSVGERLNAFLSYFMKKIKSNSIFYDFKNKNVSNFDLIIVEFVLTLVLVFSASYVFHIYEGWSYFDCIYYSFITLTTIGFGDLVPLQKNNYLKNNQFYFIFTISFIMTGLIILASTINLLVLYLVNINSEEKLRKRMRVKQKKQEQLRKMLIGDVISAVNKQDVVTFKDELPNVAFNEETSVCSCEDIAQCYKSYAKKMKTGTFDYMNNIKNKKLYYCYGGSQQEQSLLNKKNRFTILRKPTKVSHLSGHSSKSDYMLKFMDKTELAMRRLAYEADFISLKKIERRGSI